MRTNDILGYRVFHEPSGEYVHHNQHGNFIAPEVPDPISQPDALRRLAATIETREGAFFEDFVIEPVYRETTPIEDAASELGGLLEGLCAKHGLDLGISRAQMNAMLAEDLAAVRERGISGLIAGIPNRKR